MGWSDALVMAIILTWFTTWVANLLVKGFIGLKEILDDIRAN